MGIQLNEFRFIYKGKRYYYEGIPLTIFAPATEWDDKYALKQLLIDNNLPVAQGEKFTNTMDAVQCGKALGFPLVVKPVTGSLSHHCTRSIRNTQELLHAIKIAKAYRPDFIVEQHIEGSLYRATVIGQSKVFVCKKERANVVGNGHMTIRQLIDLKNSHPSRGEEHQRNTSLHKIAVDFALMKNLDIQGVTLDSVPVLGKVIYLQDKFILGLGCDIINVSNKTHPINQELFTKLSKLLGTQLVGIDFICPDISIPYTDQKAAILEVNSLPYIDMHQYPSEGHSEPIQQTVWDMVLEKLGEIRTTNT